MDTGLVAGVVALGVVHGVLPDHGWPIAATYALDRSRKWLSGTVAALVLGVGHLVSSIVLVLAYFWFATFAAFAEGPYIKPLAGTLLVALGIYEFRTRNEGHAHGHGGGSDDGHGHADGHTHVEDSDDHHAHADDEYGRDSSHDHTHDSHDHLHERRSQGDTDGGVLTGFRERLPDGGHRHLEAADAERGLRTLGVTALVLGFAHEEPIQILAICAGTEFCLELMLAYSLAVIVAILVPTLLLIAGYQSHRERVEQYTPYLPTITAAVLVGVGLAFIAGVF